MNKELRIIQNKPALLLNDYLIIADLHIGYEKELRKKGYHMPMQVQKQATEIIKLGRKHKKQKIILLGDIKHNLGKDLSTTSEVKWFLEAIKQQYKEIILIKGNHDGRIQEINEVKQELIINKVGLIHGHLKPSPEILKNAETIILAHTHPVHLIKTELGRIIRNKCWKIGKIKNKKAIIIPCYNELMSGSEKIIGPMKKEFQPEETLLLDLTKVE